MSICENCDIKVPNNLFCYNCNKCYCDKCISPPLIECGFYRICKKCYYVKNINNKSKNDINVITDIFSNLQFENLNYSSDLDCSDSE